MNDEDVLDLAIATVTLGSWNEAGEPIPHVVAAVCEVCGAWAVRLNVATTSTSAGAAVADAHQRMHDTLLTPAAIRRVARQTQVVAYSCAEHERHVVEALVDEFGYATNSYEANELAMLVEKRQRSDWRDAQVV